MAEQVTATKRPPRNISRRRAIFETIAPILILIFGITVSWTIATSRNQSLANDAAIRFGNEEDRGLTEITRRMSAYEDLLHSAHGLLVANPNTNQVQWEEFVGALDLPQRYPGLLGLGYVAYVQSNDLPKFVDATRADNAPNFTVRPVGSRNDYFVVKYVEPLAANSATLGLDLGADPAQRQAAEDARDSGLAVLTPKLNLPQDPTAQSGLIMFVPVYQTEMHGGREASQLSVSERRQYLIGWIYGALRARDVFAGLLPTGQTDLGFEIFDSNNTDLGNLLWDSNANPASNMNPAITDRKQLQVIGRNWTVGVSTLPTFDAGQSSSQTVTLLAIGSALSLLLALLLASFINTGRNASALAQRMTLALRESEERFRLIAENAADLIAVVDRNNRRLYNSPSYKTVLGYTPDELQRTTALEQVHPDDRTRVANVARESLETGAGRTIEYRMRHKDGTYRILESIGTVVRDEKGELRNLVVVARDITARKKSEEEIARGASLLRATLESTADGILVVSQDGTLTSFNQKFTELWRVPAAVVTANNYDQLIARLRDQLTAPEMLVPRAQETFSNPEASSFDTLEFKDGRVFERYSQPQLIAGTSVGRVWSFRDVTARKRAEESLRRQNEYLSALQNTTLALVAHLNLERLLNDLVTRATQLVGVKHGYITLIEPDGNAMVTRVGVGVFAERIGDRLKPGQGLAGQVWQAGHARTVDDYQKDPARMPGSNLDILHSLTAFPLKSGERIVGVIGVARDELGRTFNEDELAALTQFSQLASVALDNARLYDQLEFAVQERTAELRQSEERFRTIAETTPVTILISRIEDGTILYVNPSGGEMVGIAAEQLIGAKTPNIYYDATERLAMVDKLRKQGFVENEEVRLRRADGLMIWSLASIKTIKFQGQDAILTVAQDITTRKKADEAIRRQNAYLAALQETTLGLVRRLDVNELLHDIVVRAGELVGTEHGYVYLLAPDEREMELRVGAGLYDDLVGARTREGVGLAGLVWQTNQPFVLEDYQKWPQRLPGARRDLLHAVVGVPLRSGERTVGVIGLAYTEEERRFGESEMDVLSRLAQLAAVALDNAQLYAEAESLYRATTQLNVAKTYDDVIRVLEQNTILGQNSQNVNISYFDRPWLEGQKPEWVEVLARSTTMPPEIFAARYSVESFPSLENLLTLNGPTVIDNTETDPRMDDNARALFTGLFRAKSTIFAPLVVGGQWIGFVNAHYPQPTTFSEASVRRLRTLTSQAAVVVQNLRQYETNVHLLQETQRQQVFLDSVVEHLPVMVWIKDAKELRYISINKTFEEILGIPRSELLGKNAFDMFLPDEAERFEEQDREVLKKNELLDVPEESVVSHTRGARVIHTQKIPILDANHEPIYLLAIAEDVTERKKIEASVQRQNLYLAALQETTLGLVSRLDVNELLQDLVKRAGSLVGTEHGYVYLLETNGQEMKMRVGTGLYDDIVGAHTTPGSGLAGHVWQSGQLMVLDDYQKWPQRLPGARRDLLHAVVGVPLKSGDRIVGVIGLAYTEPDRRFHESELDILNRFAQLGSIALDNALLYQATERTVAELTTLNNFSQALTGQLDLASLVKLVGDEILKIYKMSDAFIALYNPRTNRIDFPYNVENGVQVEHSGLEMGQGITSHILKTHLPILLNYDSERRAAELGALHWAPTQSFIGVPILHGDQAIGVISVQSEREGLFEESDVRLLSTIAATMSVALQNARLFGDLQRGNSQLSAINQIGQALNKLADPQEIVETLYQMFGQVLGNDNLYVALYDEKTDYISFPVYTIDGERRAVTGRKASNGLTDYVIRSRKPLLFPREVEQGLAGLGIASIGRVSKSLLAVPILAGDKCLGVITLQDYEHANVYDASHLGLVQTIASQTAAALENSRLFKQAETRANEMAVLHDSARDFAERLDAETLFQRVYANVKRLMPLDAFFVATYDEANNLLKYDFMMDEGQRFHDLPTQPPQGRSQTALEGGEPVLTCRTQEEMEQIHERGESGAGTGKVCVSAMFVPIRLGSHKLGVISVQSYEFDAYDVHSLDLINNVASGIAVALENTRLFQAAQEELEERKRANARLLDAVENLDAGFVMYGPDECLVICNSRYKELYPASANLMMEGTPYQNILRASYRSGNYVYTGLSEDEWVAQRLTLHRAAGSQGAYEQRVGERWVRINDARASDGGVISLRTDITDRKRAEREILRFKLGIDRSQDAMFITDPDGTIIYANPAFEIVYGFKPEEAIGKTPRIFKSGVVPQEQYKTFWSNLLNKQVVAGEIINRRKDGRLIPVEGVNNPILDENGGIIGFFGIHRDITDRKRAEEILRANAERERITREITGQVSSSINTEQILKATARHLAQALGASHAIIRLGTPKPNGEHNEPSNGDSNSSDKT